MKYYAGIGSRETPLWAGDILTQVGEKLALEGWVGRSGGAPPKAGFVSADQCFQKGAQKAQGSFVVYLPKSSFYGQTSKTPCCVVPKETFPEAWAEASQIAQAFHPNWQALIHGKYPDLANLMIRNVFQVLGDDLKTPSRFVLCYAKGSQWEGVGKDAHIVNVQGGTGQAVRIANHYGIPVYNIAEMVHLHKIIKWLNISIPDEIKPMMRSLKS